MLQTINYKFWEQIIMEEEDFTLHFISNVVKQLHGAVLEMLLITQLVEMLSILWDSEIHYHVHKSLPLVSIQNKMNPHVVFFLVISYILVGGYKCFGGSCCLHFMVKVHLLKMWLG
jgi:hypothetical protein